MSIVNQMNISELDVEWTHLIMTARKMGLSMDDIRTFLKKSASQIQSEPAKPDSVRVHGDLHYL